MTLEEIQKRIDAMPAAMAAKGKRRADAMLIANANSRGWVSAQWERSDGGDYSNYEHFYFDTPSGISAALDSADAWISELPSIEKANMQEFMSALGAVVEKGKSLNIDIDFVNPLVETMKRLSKNALTDQRAA